MKGNIYTNQKCPVCGSKMIHNERRNNCFCEACDVPASGGYFVRFGRDICKRFKNNYPLAAQFLNGIRFETAKGTFDKRDYQKDFPLGFITQSEKWLAMKAEKVRTGEMAHKSLNNLKSYMGKAMDAWGHTNIKEIGFAYIDDFLFKAGLFKTSKTRANARSCLHDFFTWVSDREDIPCPRFPKCNFQLGQRTITNWETQGRIVDEIKKLTYDINPKIWFAVELLASYVEFRPQDLLRIREKDFDEGNGFIIVFNPTKQKNKFRTVRLTETHTSMWADLQAEYTGLPDMPFFRHISDRGRTKAGDVFGPRILSKWWDKACVNIGVEGVDLYGGTRHTTTTELARVVGTDGARKATGHTTNKAFDRYCQVQDESAFEMAKVIEKRRGKKGKVIPLKQVDQR